MRCLLVFLITMILVVGASRICAETDYFIPSIVGSSAKSVRLGNVNGFSNVSDSVFDNPAALYRVNKFSSSLFATKFMEEVSYQNFSCAVRLPQGVLAFGYMSAGVQDLIKTDKLIYDGSISPLDPNNYELISIGNFSYSNQLMKVAYALSQNKYLHLGISGSYFSTVVDTYSASGFNVDMGVAIESGPLSISIAAKNIIPSLKVNYRNSAVPTYNESESLPLETIYGARYKMDAITLMGQMGIKESNKKLLKAFGADYAPPFLKLLHLSVGYKEFVVVNEIKGSTSMGIGLELKGVNFDYAYEQSDHIMFNNKHYFSVGFSF